MPTPDNQRLARARELQLANAAALEENSPTMVAIRPFGGERHRIDCAIMKSCYRDFMK